MWKASMLFKKHIFFLLVSFIDPVFAAQSPAEEFFGIELVEDSSLWGQVINEKSDEKRVVVILNWLNEGIPYLRKQINRNERLLDVYFWEQVPRTIEDDKNRQEFVTEHLNAYFYSSSSKLIIFPRISIFYRNRGSIAVAEGDYLNYSSFSSVVNQALSVILK